VDSFYLIQALVYDTFDFAIAIIITIFIYRVA